MKEAMKENLFNNNGKGPHEIAVSMDSGSMS